MNVAYRRARAEGRLIRSLYARMIPRIVKRPISQTKRIPVSVYAFSCESLLPEQVASTRSFIQHVGVPERFIVVSDGTYSDASRIILERLHECVQVVDWTSLIDDAPDCVTNFAERHPMGKKLAILVSLPVNNATIYTDCDMLFFPDSADLTQKIESNNGGQWYLPDCFTSLDVPFLKDDNEKLEPVNAGFMVLKKRLDWTDPLKRLAEYEAPGWATEQTIVHLAMHNNHAQPLSPDKYILRVEDEFIYRDLYAGNNIALRHYVNNVRHKFWQSIGLSMFQN